MSSTPPISPAAPEQPAVWWRFGEWLFPIALWFASTFFYFGQTGKYLDDWSYLRPDPSSRLAAAPDSPFWRPLERFLLSPLITAFSDREWVPHLLGALVHAGVCLLLWRLLLLLRVSRLGAALAVTAFLVYPACFEAVLWMSALPTLLAAALIVAAWILACRYARGDVHPAIGYPVIPAVFFAAACLNEQAACGVVAIPFLCLASRDPDQPVRPVLHRALFTAGFSVLAIGASVALHAALRLCLAAPGADAALAGLSTFPGSAARAVARLGEQFLAADMISRAFSAGMQAAAEHPARAAAIASALIAGLVCWAAAPRGDQHRPRESRPVLLLLAAAAACAATIVPVFALAPAPSMAYAPALGLTLLIGAAAIALAPLLARPLPRTVLVAAAGIALSLCSITMMGFQRGYRERSIQDRRELAQLRTLIPDPMPDSVFVPVRVAEPIPGPRADRYDRYFGSPFRAGPAARAAIQWAYGRADLTSGDAPPDQSSLTAVEVETADIRGVGPVPWPRVIPFTIDDAGQTHLVTRISSGTRTVSIPQTQSLVARPHAVALPDAGPAPRVERLAAGNTGPTSHASSSVAPGVSVGSSSSEPGGGSGELPVAVAADAPSCYANCDNSTSAPVLNVLDFSCFLNRFSAGDAYANCDGSRTPPVLNVNDFACFLNHFAAGCP